MNSFRIAVTGILVAKGWGEHTEGFLHLFEGWIVFLVATAFLMAVIWLLVTLLPGRRKILDVLAWRVQDTTGPVYPRTRSGNDLRIVTALLLVSIAGSWLASQRGEFVPDRISLQSIPEQIGTWSARVDRLPVEVEGVAGASEYFYGDFVEEIGERVNVYVAYYENQRHGQIPHSPKVCIPGGGWVILNESTVTLPIKGGLSLVVNRIVTGLAERTVVSYYWLKQGRRVHRKEFLARLDLVRTALLENRTDGALVRLVAELRTGEGLADADARLQRFATEFVPLLPHYVPD